MRNIKYFIKQLIVMGSFISLLLSCSYGNFNFSAETGSLELDFIFTGDNTLDVDRIDYELTPPAGLSTKIREEFSGNLLTTSFDNMDAGSWSIKGSLYANGTLVQEFAYSTEIVNDEKTRLSMEASWNSAEYDIIFQLWQITATDEDPSGVDEPSTPLFSVSDIKVMPALLKEHRSGNNLYAVNIRIIGTNLDSDVAALKLVYPDNYIYEYGTEDHYDRSRTVLISHKATDVMIEIQRNQFDLGETLNGNYQFTLRDPAGATIEYPSVVNLDFDALIPDVLNHNGSVNIPVSINSTVLNDFEYMFSSAAGIGTRLVMMVDRQNGLPYPSDNSIAVASDSGTLSILGGALPAGDYELILASIEYSTLTPYDQAIAAGVSDMRSEQLVQNLYEIYGENTGFVCFRSVSLSFY